MNNTRISSSNNGIPRSLTAINAPPIPVNLPPTLATAPRNTARHFLPPSKKIISQHANELGVSSARTVMQNSDLAHRMSFADIKKIVLTHRMDHRIVKNLIKTLTIPARDYGGVLNGSLEYYNFVNKNAVSKTDLIKLLNSCPFNLRPGNASENRAIGQSMDPNLSTFGRRTPLSQSISDFQDSNPSCTSPPLKFDQGTHRYPANVDKRARPQFRSSTSITEQQLEVFEKRYIALWRDYRPRNYSVDQPFQ